MGMFPELRGTLWLTGLSGAGKSTIAELLHQLLEEKGISSYLLDGDNLRKGLNSDLGFGERERTENVRRLGEVALLFADAGYLSIVSAISPFVADRKMVRERHKSFGVLFVEIYVATPLSVCEARDSKGLYARARAGELALFTGVTQPYEAPESPEVTANEFRTPKENALEVLAYLANRGFVV